MAKIEKMKITTRNTLWTWCLNISATISLLFMIIFTPILCELIWESNDMIIANNGATISLLVLLPVLVSTICWLVLYWKTPFKHFTKEDAIAQVEKHFASGLISSESYTAQIKHIELFDLEKNKLRASIEIEKMKLQMEIDSFAKVAVVEADIAAQKSIDEVFAKEKALVKLDV